MNKHLSNLMEKEMSRKEFLGTLALAAGSIMGFSTIVHLLTGKSLNSRLGRHANINLGYGSSVYGGNKE